VCLYLHMPGRSSFSCHRLLELIDFNRCISVTPAQNSKGNLIFFLLDEFCSVNFHCFLQYSCPSVHAIQRYFELIDFNRCISVTPAQNSKGNLIFFFVG
jgi:hypothetical protein